MATSKEVKQIVGAFELRLSGAEREALGVLRSAHDFARAGHRRRRSIWPPARTEVRSWL